MMKNSVRQKQRDWEWRRYELPAPLAEEVCKTKAGNVSVWQCRKYAVTLSRFPDWTALLSIYDPACRHRWQDMQRIKNDLLGDHWSAVEVYPRQDLVLDQHNQYHLWCTPHQLRIGWDDGGEYTVQHTFYGPDRLKETLDISLPRAEPREWRLDMFASTT